MAKAKVVTQPIDSTMDALNRALYLSDTYEVYTFPLPPNKKFTTANWHKQSHNLSSDIKEEFKGISKNSNIGIDLSKFTNPNYRLFALDFDVEKETNKDGSVKKVDGKPVLKKDSTKHLNQFQDIIKRFDIPHTLTTRSASGGFHVILKVEKDVYNDVGIKSSTKKEIRNYDRLDIITGNVVAPTSVISGSFFKEYTFIDTSLIEEAPSKLLFWLKNEVFHSKVNSPNKKTGTQGDFTTNFEISQEECLQYIINMAPRAIEGEGGDETTLKVSDYLWDLTDNEDIVITAMDLYNKIKCTPPWDTTTVEYKKFLRHPSQRAYRQTEAGEKGPKEFDDFPRYIPLVNQFGKITVKRKNLFDVVLSRSNSRDQGKVKDYTEIPQKVFQISTSYKIKGNYIDHTLAKSIIGTYELKRLYLNNAQVETNYEYVNFVNNKNKGKGPSKDTVIKYLNKSRRFFTIEDEAFMPNFSDDIIHNGIYNTFNGYAVEYSQMFDKLMQEKRKVRVKGQKICDRFFDILKLWADDDDELYIWLKQWFAKRVQDPSWKPQTAIIVEGEYGSGKSIILYTLKMMMGMDYVRILSNSELENDFNGLNENSLLTVFDEIDTIKDPRIIKKLDAKIGNSSEIINKKGVDQTDRTSYSGIVITCNDLPKGLLQTNQRRYQICFMSEKYTQDKEYFKPLFFTNDSSKIGNLTSEEIEGLILIYKVLAETEIKDNVDTLMFNRVGMIKIIEQFEYKTKGLSTWFITRVMQGQFNGHLTGYILSDEPIEISIPPLWDDYAAFAVESNISEYYTYDEFSQYIKRNSLYSISTRLIKTNTNKRKGQQKRRINYKDNTGRFFDQVYMYEWPKLETLKIKVFNALGASVIKNMENGQAIINDFLEDYVSIPPYDEIMEMKQATDEAEFEQFSEDNIPDTF